MTTDTTTTTTNDTPQPAPVITNPKPGTWYAPVPPGIALSDRPGILGDATHIKVTVRYDLGGMNYATYTQNPRGYYLSVGPVTRETRSETGVTMERFAMFGHSAYVLEETKRLNNKRLAEWYGRISALIPQLVTAALDTDKDQRNAAVFALIRS